MIDQDNKSSVQGLFGDQGEVVLKGLASYVLMESMTLLEKIDAILKGRGLKRVDLASMIGVTPQRVSNWFQGTGQPKPFHLLLIARALGTTMEFLADDKQEVMSEPEISPEEWKVIEMVREIGVDVARRRILQAPTVIYKGPGKADEPANPLKLKPKRSNG